MYCGEGVVICVVLVTGCVGRGAVCVERVSIGMIWWPAILEIVLKREVFVMLAFDRFRFFT
tara:strand:+ start:217 stop:399 length:183 start_codon:yes stop_codon:yes gene_type:complete